MKILWWNKSRLVMVIEECSKNISFEDSEGMERYNARTYHLQPASPPTPSM